MRSWFKRVMVSLLAMVSVVAIAAAPAQAGPGTYEYYTNNYHFKCSYEVKWFSLPGKSDVWFQYDLCLGRKGNTMAVTTSLSQGSNIPYTGSGHRWDGLELVIHLERRANGTNGPDHVVKTLSCNVTNFFNDHLDGSYDECRPFTGQTDTYWWPGVAYDQAYDWSVDGVLHYDIDNDGLGWDYWNFTGSPLHY